MCCYDCIFILFFLFVCLFSFSTKKVNDLTLDLEQERNRVGGASPAGGKLSVMHSPARSESDM